MRRQGATETCLDQPLAGTVVIVYCLHEKIGHLGIFVSAKVAGREHAEIMSAINLIDILPLGLYEALIEDTRPDMPNLELIEGRYLIKFEPRTLDAIRALDDGRDDERPFSVVRRVAEINQSLYDTFLSPAVKTLSNEVTAQGLRALQSSRLQGAVKRQMFTLLLDEERAINALPKLLPDRHQRQQVLKRARLIATARAGQLSAAQERRFQHLEEILGITGSKE